MSWLHLPCTVGVGGCSCRTHPSSLYTTSGQIEPKYQPDCRLCFSDQITRKFPRSHCYRLRLHGQVSLLTKRRREDNPRSPPACRCRNRTQRHHPVMKHSLWRAPSWSPNAFNDNCINRTPPIFLPVSRHAARRPWFVTTAWDIYVRACRYRQKSFGRTETELGLDLAAPLHRSAGWVGGHCVLRHELVKTWAWREGDKRGSSPSGLSPESGRKQASGRAFMRLHC